MRGTSVITAIRRGLTALLLVPSVLSLVALALQLVAMVGLALLARQVGGSVTAPLWPLLTILAVFVGGLALVYAAWRFDKSTTRTAWLSPLAAGCAFGVLVPMVAHDLYVDVSRKARLAADQGTVAALRTAAQTYYSQHGTWPSQAGLQGLVRGFDGQVQCPDARWGFDSASGVVTYTPNDISACR